MRRDLQLYRPGHADQRAQAAAEGVRLDRRRLSRQGANRRSTTEPAAPVGYRGRGPGLQRPARHPAHRQGPAPGLLPRLRRAADGGRGRQAVRLCLPRSRKTRPRRSCCSFTSTAVGPSAPTGAMRMPSLTARKARRRRCRSGELPEAGKWVRLEVDAAALGLKPGTKINGMAFTQFDGTAYWDKAGLGLGQRPGPGSRRSRCWPGRSPSAPLGDKSHGAADDQGRAQEGAAQAGRRSDRNKLRDYFLA